jgi:hypothetical protein
VSESVHNDAVNLKLVDSSIPDTGAIAKMPGAGGELTTTVSPAADADTLLPVTEHVSENVNVEDTGK